MMAALTRPRLICAGLALLTAAFAIAAGVRHPAQFFALYLFAAMLWLNPALGCLLIGFIHRLTGGTWGLMLAPYLAAGRRTLPWALLFSAPLLFGTRDLFAWAGGGSAVEHGHLLLYPHRVYLSELWYVLRAICYAVAILFLLWAARRPLTDSWVGPWGMIVYVATVYLLSVDWIMTLEPGWVSTGFPVVFMASQALSAFALCIGAAIWDGLEAGSPPPEGPARGWKDLGNLLLAAVMFWAYLSYAQFLIVWSGNLPKEAGWYLHRNAGGWHYVLIALVLLNLLAPVLLLLSSRIKSRSRALGLLALEVLGCQAVYLYWLILPSFQTEGIVLGWLDALLPAAAMGCALFFYLGGLLPERSAA
jgi:hypothetical protein